MLCWLRVLCNSFSKKKYKGCCAMRTAAFFVPFHPHFAPPAPISFPFAPCIAILSPFSGCHCHPFPIQPIPLPRFRHFQGSRSPFPFFHAPPSCQKMAAPEFSRSGRSCACFICLLQAIFLPFQHCGPPARRWSHPAAFGGYPPPRHPSWLQTSAAWSRWYPSPDW